MVAVLPSNPNVVLMGTGEGNGAGVWGVGLLKSSSGSSSPADPNVICANFTSRNTCQSLGVYRSDDNGLTMIR